MFHYSSHSFSHRLRSITSLCTEDSETRPMRSVSETSLVIFNGISVITKPLENMMQL